MNDKQSLPKDYYFFFGYHFLKRRRGNIAVSSYERESGRPQLGPWGVGYVAQPAAVTEPPAGGACRMRVPGQAGRGIATAGLVGDLSPAPTIEHTKLCEQAKIGRHVDSPPRCVQCLVGRYTT